MCNNSPLITIIIAVFNGAKTLQRCIDSINKQVYKNTELIIMDGASTDGTVPILEQNDSNITYWESKNDKGIAHAWNKALAHVKGDWVIFLGADDRFESKSALSDVVDKLQNDLISDVVYGRLVFEGGQNHGVAIGRAHNLSILKRRMFIPHPATFHRKKLFDEIGLFDQSFKMAMDYELLLRKKKLTVKFIDYLITIMGGDGVSSRLIRRSLLEGRSAQLKNKVDFRFKIELLHAFYQLRHQFNSRRIKGLDT